MSQTNGGGRIGVPIRNQVVLVGWRGSVDLDVAFSDFFFADHTIAVRFMPQYTHAYAGPYSPRTAVGAILSGWVTTAGAMGGLSTEAIRCCSS
jgi:hypothetical protein